MKIAIVCPSSVPFTIGGLEKLAWKLTTTINETTSHKAELIKLPLKEDSFFNTVISYLKFYFLDLQHFDLIISTKYPSWMVRHPYHIVYMVHPLRGLYDSFQGETNFWSYLKESPFRFAGIYMRAVIRFFDRIGLSPKRIKAYYAISRTVSKRKGYFKKGLHVKVLYPPSTFQNDNPSIFEMEEQHQLHNEKYFFTVSRLDAPKRIELIINAMKYVKGNFCLLIAGEGAYYSFLKKLAGKDKRIKFLGNVTTSKLRNYYMNSIAVIFVPVNEDYGLVTIEAMQLKKAVITTSDSGGPSEIVDNGRTGFVVAPNPQTIAEKMDFLFNHPDENLKLGKKGYEKVKDITWEKLVYDLLKDHDYVNTDFEHHGDRRKVCVLSTYPIFPSRGGGQERIYNVYKSLSNHYDVTILSFSPIERPFVRNQITPHCLEISIPQSEAHSNAQWKIQEEIKHTVTDIVMPKLAHLTPQFGAILDYYLKKSDIIIASHPFLFPLIKRQRNNQLIIYESHNVEYLLKKSFLPSTIKGRWLLSQVKRVESKACSESDIVFNTSPEEQENLAKIYNLNRSKAFVAPNGVDTSILFPVSFDERREARKILGFPETTTVLFMGSWHPPNLDAFKFILEKLSSKLPELTFVVMGSVREEYYSIFDKQTFPKNVIAVGAVNEKTKITILHAGDIAINPVNHGSGTNLKMLDYMATGLPVISTPVGARGFTNKEEDCFILCERDEFESSIRALLGDKIQYRNLANKARELVLKRFDWKVIIRQMYNVIENATISVLKKSISLENDEQLGTGWYGPEVWQIPNLFGSNQKNVRWTSNWVEFFLPNLGTEQYLWITFETFNQKLKGEIILENETKAIFKGVFPSSGERIEIPILTDVMERELKFVLKTEVWVPALFYNNDDNRELGVPISGIGIEEIKTM